MTDFVTPASGNAVAAIIGAIVQGHTRKADDRRRLRREAAEDLLAWVPELRRRLVLLELECDDSEWRNVMERAYASCRRVYEVAPPSWRHLKHSLLDAIGNGAGAVVWVDIAPAFADGSLVFDKRWTTNAAEYLEYLQSGIQSWSHAYTERQAKRVQLRSYSDWLLRTDRVHPVLPAATPHKVHHS